MKKAILLTLVSLFCIHLFSQDFLQYREITKLNNWKFYKGDYPYAQQKTFSKSETPTDKYWDTVQVPHTWNHTDVLTKAHASYKGIGWYRKYIHFSSTDLEKRQFLRFEGVSVKAWVYVNGK